MFEVQFCATGMSTSLLRYGIGIILDLYDAQTQCELSLREPAVGPSYASKRSGLHNFIEWNRIGTLTAYSSKGLIM